MQLITALGKNTDLVLQLVDFINDKAELSSLSAQTKLMPLRYNQKYRYNEETSDVRQRFSGWKITDLHLITTTEVEACEKALREQLVLESPGLRVHSIPLPCDGIACIGDDETMRRLIYDRVESLAVHNLIRARIRRHLETKTGCSLAKLSAEKLRTIYRGPR